MWDKVKDVLTFKENRLQAHAEMKTILLGDKPVSNRFLYLDGEWNFAYAENRFGVPEGFESEDYDCHSWNTIRVPGHIQLQGYDVPHYTNIPYPWDGKENLKVGEVPERFNPVGCYVKYFDIAEADLEDEIRLSLQGVESGAGIWLNGRYVGYMENSFDPSEFDITPFLKVGENKLAMQVYKWTTSSWCEDQDFFVFSGIYRSVYLYRVPKQHMEDIKIRTILDDSFETAELKVSVKTTEVVEIGYKLYYIGLGTDPELDFYRNDPDKLVAEGSLVDMELSLAVDKPKLWSAEKPYLYRLVLSTATEEVAQLVGFRRFELKNGLMLINGKRIVLKGVNRHEFSCYTGRAVSDEDIISDILTMKRNNINAVRTCHYPDDVRIYDLFDRYGLYVIAENNMETHGATNLAIEERIPRDRIEWEPMLLDRVNSCYQRDKNHPSIIIWSLGNESSGGLVLRHMYELFHQLDQDRLVHYEGMFWDRRYNCSDMESQMYTPVEGIKKFLAENPGKPFICCEYMHAMGNSCGAMHKYTDLTDTEPRYQGGFIWDFIDQAIMTKDKFGNEYLGYGGDFGDRPASYEFSGDGLLYGDRSLSPKMQEVKFNYQNISIYVSAETITVVNKSLFTSTSEYAFTAQLYRDGMLIDEKEMDIRVVPGGTGIYTQPFVIPSDPGEYCVRISATMKEATIYCDKGHEVAFGESVVAVNVPEQTECIEGFEIIQGIENLGIKGKDFSVLFGGASGGIVSYVFKGKEMIDRVPKPNFWRAPTSNDSGYGFEQIYSQWKIASLYATHKTPEFWAKGGPDIEPGVGCLKISLNLDLMIVPKTMCRVTYTVYGDGRIDISMNYTHTEGLIEMPEFGFIFDMDGNFENVEWYGLGPDETYADRCKGGKLGIYSGKVKEQMAHYLMPQECGNKQEVRWIRVTDSEGHGLEFSSKKPMSASALPYSPHQLEIARHEYELPQPVRTVVRASLAQMGVGGDDTWGAKVHPEYHICVDKPLEFTFTIKGL